MRKYFTKPNIGLAIALMISFGFTALAIGSAFADSNWGHDCHTFTIPASMERATEWSI